MPGRLLAKTWQYDPTILAPASFKRACRYECFIPDELSSLRIELDATVVGLVSEAEHAIRAIGGEIPDLYPIKAAIRPNGAR